MQHSKINNCIVIIIFAYYGYILNRLKFVTLYFMRRHVGALFLINIFKSQANYPFNMNTVSIHVPSKQIIYLSTLSCEQCDKTQTVLELGASLLTCKFLVVSSKNSVSFRDIISIGGSVQIDCIFFVLFLLGFV
jgi:hypothetical protein